MKKLIKDILFPVFCVECGREGEWWCSRCLENTLAKDGIVFKKEIKTGVYLDGCFSFMDYTAGGGSLKKLIKQFKYERAKDITAIWQKIIGDCAADSKKFFGAVLMSVPLHPRRFRERGFNQAEVLKKIIFDRLADKELKIEAGESNLERRRYTRQQARLTREERFENIAGAFAWPSEKSAPEKVILVDDVFTTGATMEECAKILKQNGSKAVWGITLARG